MSKILNKTKKISTSMLFFIALVAVIITSINASIESYTTNVLDLAKEAQNDSWFDYSPSKDFIGKKIDITAVDNYNNALNYNSAYCIDPHTAKNNGTSEAGYYDIVNVFDINKNNNTVVIYSLENPQGKEYSLTDERVKPVIMLSYLTQQATLNPSDLNTFGYKDVIERIFNNEKWIADLREIGLSNAFKISNDLEYLIAVNGRTGNLDSATDKINAAADYAENLMKQGSSETAELNDSAMSQAEKDSVSMTRTNGKTFIGPYRVKLTQTTVGEIKVNGENAVGISTDGTTVESFDKIKNGEKFWVVTQKDYSEITNITVKAKESISYLQSRMVLLGNSPSQNFLVWRNKEIPQQPEYSLEVPKLGTLEIQKVDELADSNVSLKGIEFRVYAERTGWVKKNGDHIEFVEKYNDAEKFYTDENGKITINNLPTYRYSIYETNLPEDLQKIYTLGRTKVPGNEDFTNAKRVVRKYSNGNTANITFKVPAGQTVTVTATNDRAFTDVYVQKTDHDTGKALNGYEFRLYRTDEGNQGWVRAENNVVLEEKTYTTDFEDSKVAKLVTVNGVTPKLTKLPVGTYELYETKLGENGEAYGLGTFKKDGKTYTGKLVDTKQITANATGEYEFEIENVQQYIKISGFVWEDVLQGKNGQTRDGKYAKNDYKLQGIKVKLIDTKTYETRETITDENGEYSFENVKVRENENSEANYLNNYKVEFDYDGFTYQGIITSQQEIEKYTTGEIANFYEYEKINETSSKACEDKSSRQELNNQFAEITGEGQKLLNGIELVYKNTDGDITLDNTAKIEKTNTGYKVNGTGDFPINSYTQGSLLQEYFNKLKSSKEVVSEISYINLGVYRREMPNLTLQKDLYSAEVSVNGYTYTYNYNQKLKMENPTDTSLAVDFDGDYSLPIYKADAKYTGSSNTLQASVIYKIKLQNASTNLYTKIKEINEIYSDDYEFQGELYLSSNYKIDKDIKKLSATVENGKIILSEPIELASANTPNGANTKFLYIKLKIKDPTKLYELAEQNNGETPSGLENKAEIGKYSVYSDEFKTYYAGIDSTSIPNNFQKVDEDDDDNAPGLKIVDAGERNLSGTVFEDADADGVVGVNQERIGNSIFDNGEKTIAGVKAQLVDLNGNKVQVYNGSEWVDAEITTDASGNFTISGFLPGTYNLVYTWGDENGYKVEDYKGTIYVNKERANDVNWFKQEDPRYSDAIDDYNLRIAIDQKALFNKDTEGYSDLSKMKSTTPKFVIGIEKEEYQETPGETGFKFNVNNMDFGIIERPRQAMEINKNLSSIIVTEGDSTPLVNAKIEDGKLKVFSGEKWVTGGEDYIWVQVDKNITHGMKVEMGYNITVSNVSETDYDNEEYYKYGTKTGKPSTMTLKAEAVYDYCKGASLGSNNTTTWEVVKPGNYEFKTKETQTITDTNFTEQYSKMVNEDGTINEEYNWENTYEEMGKLYSDWLEEMAQTKTTNVTEVKLDNREILKYVGEELLQPLAPGQSKTAEVKTSKLIENGDDIRFDNDAEITHIEYNTDARTGRKPSAYTSKTYARAGWTSITPATGEDRDYTWIIITAVSAIAVLGVGIIIIKKKVLK